MRMATLSRGTEDFTHLSEGSLRSLRCAGWPRGPKTLEMPRQASPSCSGRRRLSATHRPWDLRQGKRGGSLSSRWLACAQLQARLLLSLTSAATATRKTPKMPTTVKAGAGASGSATCRILCKVTGSPLQPSSPNTWPRRGPYPRQISRVSTSSPRLTSAYAGREVGWRPSWRAREATGPGRCCRKRFPGRSPGRYRSWTPVSCHRGTRRRRYGYPCSTPASEAYCYSHEVLRNELSNELRTCTPSTTVCLTSPPCGHDSTTRLHDSVTQVPLTAV